MARPDEGTTLLEQVLGMVLEQCSCAACSASYQRENIHVLEQLDAYSWLIALVCHECLKPRVLQVEAETKRRWAAKSRPEKPATSAPTISAAEPPTSSRPPSAGELTPAERRRRRTLEPLTADDLLDFVAALKSFDGDVDALLGPDAEP